MFKIKTYIKKPAIQIYNLKEITENPNKYFLDMCKEKEIEQYAAHLDMDYIEGAIIIKYNDRYLMDVSLWDLVDQLWSYFLHVVEGLIETGYGEAYFPDQPVKIEMKAISKDLVLFRLDEGKVISEFLPKKIFTNALLESANLFFTRFNPFVDRTSDFADELHKIKVLQKRLLAD